MSNKRITYKGKPASLILESRQDCQFVMEASDEHVPAGALGRLYGVYAYMDEKNANGRTYDFANYFSQVQTLMSKIKAKRLLGELEHVKRRTVKYANVSHRIDSIEWNPEKKRFEGWITILDTPAGRIVWAIVSAGSPVFISSRAIGIVNPTTGKVTLLKLITYDIVCEPGFQNAEFNLTGNVNESADTFICESVDDDDVSSKSLMLQLIDLARTGQLQKLFPDAIIGSASLDALKQQLITESLETLTDMTNQSRFVDAYNKADANAIGVENVQKVEAMLDAVGCDYTDVGIAVAFDALTAEQQKEAMALLGLEFANEGAMFKYDLSNLSNEDIVKMAKDMGYAEQGIDIEREDPMNLLHYIAVDLSNDDIAKKHAELLKKYNIKPLDESKYDISKLDDAAIIELASAMKLEDPNGRNIEELKADIKTELDANLDSYIDIAKKFGIVECDEAFNYDYLNAAWGALTDDAKAELVDACKCSNKSDIIDAKTFKDIDIDIQRQLIDVMVDKSLVEKELVNSVDEAFNIDSWRDAIEKELGFDGVFVNVSNNFKIREENGKYVVYDLTPLEETNEKQFEASSLDELYKKLDAYLNESKHDTLGAAWDSFTDDQRQSILSRHHLPYTAQTKWSAIDIAHHAMLEKDIDEFDESNEGKSFWSIWSTMSMLNRAAALKAVQPDKSDEDCFNQAHDNEDALGTELVDALKKHLKIDESDDSVDIYDKDGNKIAAKITAFDADKIAFEYNGKQSVAIKDGDKYMLYDGRYASVKDLDEAADPAADWWYNASVADRNQIIAKVGKDSIGVEDAANATWDMFDNESRNAIAAAIRAQTTDESSKAANAFLAWHDNGRPNGAKMEKLNKIYDIFMAAGCSSDMDIDKCFDSLSKADKQAVLSIAGLTDVNIDESADDNAIAAPWTMSDDIKKGDKIVVGDEKHISGTEFSIDVWPVGKPEQKLTLRFDDKKDPQYLALIDDCNESLKRHLFVCEERTIAFNDIRIGMQGFDYNDEVGFIVDKGSGIDSLTSACAKHHTTNDAKDAKDYIDSSKLQSFNWVIVKLPNAGNEIVWYVYDDSGFLVVDESIEAWNSADVATRKDWLLSKNYLEADSEYYASQAYDGLPVDVQNFVKEFFVNESDEDASVLIKDYIYNNLPNDFASHNVIVNKTDKGYTVEINNKGVAIENAVKAAAKAFGLEYQYDKKHGTVVDSAFILTGTAKLIKDEAAVGDDIKIYDADGNEFDAVVNAIDTNDGTTKLSVTYDGSTSGTVQETDGKWVLVAAQQPGVVTESILADTLYQKFSDADKALIDKYYNDDVAKTAIQNMDPDKSSFDDKVNAVFDALLALQKQTADVDALANAKDFFIGYIAAQLQDSAVNEGKIVYLPKSAKFVNEAENDSKPTAEDVENIIDGLVDAAAITRPQADELIDAVSEMPDLDKVQTKADLATKIASAAEELGFDVDVNDCLNMVNESEDSDIRQAVLKDKSYDDFDFRAINRDGSTVSVVMTKDGQLTGIEVQGELTDANQQLLASMLKSYLGAQATDECLQSIKKDIAAIRLASRKLDTQYDASGIAIMDEQAQGNDFTPLHIKYMPIAYKFIYESLTDEQKSLIDSQAAIRSFVNEADVAAFYRSRNWSAIKAYSSKTPVGFVTESVTGNSLTPEQQRLVDAIKG